MQRQKNFFAYEDLKSSFEKRPSLWAEPIGDLGEGSVQLIEIPTKEEIHDNIAGFWRPEGSAASQGRVHLYLSPALGPRYAQGVVAGAVLANRRRRQGDGVRIFVLDLIGDRLKSIDPNKIHGNVTAEKAEIKNIVTQPNPATGGWRLSFELSVKDKAPVEVRASLMQGNDAISEVWIYRWVP